VAYCVTERLGTAVGIVSAAGTAGISLTPLLVERVVAAHGLATGWVVQGLVVWAVLVPLALFGLPRRGPQTRRETGDRGGADLRVVLRAAAFWVLTVGGWASCPWSSPP
jgi:nitrate/nitrite transporter NarK